MSAFATWLAAFSKAFLVWLVNDGIDLINATIKILCTFIASLVSLFPSASTTISNGASPSSAVFTMMITCLNWLFPMAYLVTVITWTAVGVTSYFAIAPVLRWAKILT